MAEENSQNLRETNTRKLEIVDSSERYRHDEVKRGQHYALCAIIILSAMALVALLMGHERIFGTICTVTIVALSTVFITGKVSGTNDKDESLT